MTSTTRGTTRSAPARLRPGPLRHDGGRSRCPGRRRRSRQAARPGRLSRRAAHRRRAERAPDDARPSRRRRRHRLRRQRAARASVYAVEYGASGRANARTIATRLVAPSGVAWSDGKLYVGALGARAALRRHRRPSRAAARAGRRQRPLPVRRAPRPPLHRLRPRRQALRAGRRAVQHLPARRSSRRDPAHERRRRPDRDRRARRAQLGRLRLEPDRPRALVHRQRPRHARRRSSRRRARPRQQVGEHFGFPFCHQGDSPDPQFGKQRACSEFTAPAALLGAHVAALGMRFYVGTQFPAMYRGNVFIAEHGSWNRSRKSGYQVARVSVDAQGHAGAPEPFLQGFLQVDASGGETVLGRPADVLPLPDGSLLVSDDTGRCDLPRSLRSVRVIERPRSRSSCADAIAEHADRITQAQIPAHSCRCDRTPRRRRPARAGCRTRRRCRARRGCSTRRARRTGPCRSPASARRCRRS